MNTKQKIVPCVWFDTQAEEAAKFYTGIFSNSRINSVVPYPGVGQEIHGKKEGSVMTVAFELEETPFLALNGGPEIKFNPSISLFMICRNEEEIYRIWNDLFEDGKALMPLDAYDWSPRYGWLEDRYGLNWQLMIDDGGFNPAQRLSPLLFFTGQSQGKAEEAMNFYTSIFEDSRVVGIEKYSEEDKNEYALGAVKHAQFQLFGETFMVMDSAMENDHPFNEAISFMVQCKDQQEIDKYWDKLSQGGDPKAQQCGWLKDKFGISWQIVPAEMAKIMNDPDREKVNHAMTALLNMKKIKIEDLQDPAPKGHFS